MEFPVTLDIQSYGDIWELQVGAQGILDQSQFYLTNYMGSSHNDYWVQTAEIKPRSDQLVAKKEWEPPSTLTNIFDFLLTIIFIFSLLISFCSLSLLFLSPLFLCFTTCI